MLTLSHECGIFMKDLLYLWGLFSAMLKYLFERISKICLDLKTPYGTSTSLDKLWIPGDSSEGSPLKPVK